MYCGGHVFFFKMAAERRLWWFYSLKNDDIIGILDRENLHFGTRIMKITSIDFKNMYITCIVTAMFFKMAAKT